jgi:hypothetical protein
MAFETVNYQDQLLTTREQLDVLRGYNQRYWNNHFKGTELTSLNVTDEYPELDNVPIIHAEFGSAWETFIAWRGVFISSDITHWNTFAFHTKEDFNKYVQTHEQTARYEPGLHIVHMDLTQDESTYRSMNEVYAHTEETPNVLLACSEGLALVGLHRALREPENGYAREKTPYLPGYQVRDIFVPEARAGGLDWVVRFEPGRPNEDWGLRVFPTKENPSIDGAILFVHGDTSDKR